MLIYFFIAVFLLQQGANSQPTGNKGNSQQRKNSEQVNSAPVDSQNVNTEEARSPSPKSYAAEGDSKENIAKAAQSTNDRIATATIVIAVFGALSFLATCFYIIAAFLQRAEMKHQAASASEQVGKMQGQLDAIKKQSRIMMGTWHAVRRQAAIMEQGLEQTEKTVGIMHSQLVAMRGQLQEIKNQSQTSRQLFEMQAAITNPHLRVAEVRVENFKAGKEPIYIVTIANDGLIDATNVQVHMRVEMGTYKILTLINDPIVTIPAKEKEYFYIIDPSGLKQQHIDDFNKAVPLKVVGHFTFWLGGLQKFCYKYQPWDEKTERPEGVRQFVRCDYDPRLNTTVVITGNVMTGVAGTVTPIGGKAPPEEAKPQEETDPKGEDDRDKPN